MQLNIKIPFKRSSKTYFRAAWRLAQGSSPPSILSPSLLAHAHAHAVLLVEADVRVRDEVDLVVLLARLLRRDEVQLGAGGLTTVAQLHLVRVRVGVMVRVRVRARVRVGVGVRVKRCRARG